MLFGSGCAALLFQVIWVKQLSLVVGVDVYAITTAVGAFFAGLALGNALFGPKADASAWPLRFYAMLELGIGLSGAGATVALAHAGPLYVALSQHLGPFAWALPFVLVGAPALLMGGTLPVMVRAQTPLPGEVATAGGALYAANTAGAIAGALLAPFALIPALGVMGAGFAAACINLAVAAGAMAMSGGARNMASVSRPAGAGTADPKARIALGLYTVAGAIALGYEVVWSQVVVQFTSTRTFSFAVVLATYLAGLALGSALYVRWRNRVRDPWGLFGCLIAAAGLIALLQVAGLGDWIVRIQSHAEALARALGGGESLAMCARFFVAALGIVFVPTVLLGAAFPAALRLIAGRAGAGEDVGAVAALNMAGGVLGTMVTGFVLVPWLGLIHTLAVLAIGATVVGFAAAISGSSGAERASWLVVAMAACAVLAAMLTPTDRIERLLPKMRGGNLIFYEEDPGGTVAVVEQRSQTAAFRRLYIDGVSNSGDAMPSLRYMRLQALLPLIIHRGDPRAALVIGFGTGITTGALLQFDGLERRVCADLLLGVIHAGPLFRGNYGAATDPKIEIRLHDGREELLVNPETYDLITLEPPPPSAAGVVNLYSSDFYRLAARRLRPNGIFAQWWPLATQNDEDSRSLVRSFLDVFPYAALWSTEIHEAMLVGSLQPLELDAPRIAARFAQPGVSAALSEVGIASPAALLATWITGREGLERYADGALPVTDNRPRIEYAAWTRRGEFARVLPRVLALRTEPPLIGGDPSLQAAIAEERGRLLAFYDAALDAYRGDRQAWQRNIAQALEGDGGNPYYRWITGDWRP